MRVLRSLFGRPQGQRGQSIVEAVMAVAILGILAQSTALVIRALAKQNVSNRDRAFATEKALQMLEELRELVLTNSATLTTLDTYADGRTNSPVGSYTPDYKFTLTTKYNITHDSNGNTLADALTATEALSSNPVRGTGYAFVRHVDVWPNTADANTRLIYVRVFAAASNQGVNSVTQAMPTATNEPPLAEVYGMVHSQGTVVTPSQVIDMYFVALESVPGWWNRTSNLIPLMQSSVVSLQAMNPGLVIRSHWIQTMSYGRDLEYTPEINAEGNVATNSGALQKAYVYPGYVGYDSGNDYYYLPSWFLGRVNVGGSLPGTTGWPADMSNPNLGYPIADQFNHAMQEPDEVNVYQTLSNMCDQLGIPEPQLSYRMLLEYLNTGQNEVQNAIVLNLHGEMVPVPPLRNYSDAAKDPNYYQVERVAAGQPARSWRAVTQPEELFYNTTIASQNQFQAFNVYAYDASPQEMVTDTPTTEVVDHITLFMPNANVNELYSVTRVQGNSVTAYYPYVFNSASGFYTYTNGTYTAITDSPTYTTYTATFWADNYNPPGRAATGLRIQLYGTTPTARVYNGPAQ